MSTGKSFDICVKCPWLFSPFSCKWEDASTPAGVSPAGFMGGARRILEKEVGQGELQFKDQTRNYYCIDRVTSHDVLQFLL